MFWNKRKESAAQATLKPKTEKLPGPKSVPEAIGRHLVVQLKQDPDWVWGLKSVVRPRTDGKNRFDFRVFSQIQVNVKKVQVKDYTSLDGQPDLVLYQGWFDKESMQVQMEDKA